MRRIAIADEPAPVDRALHGDFGDIVVKAEAMGDVVHSDPAHGPAARYPHDIVPNGDGRALRSLLVLAMILSSIPGSVHPNNAGARVGSCATMASPTGPGEGEAESPHIT